MERITSMGAISTVMALFFSGLVFASPAVGASAPPETIIESGPAGPTSSTEAQFTFSSSEPASQFSCRLDSQPYSPCSSPHIYAGLSEGLHRVAVRATDPAGKTDPTPAIRTWTVDTRPPPRPLLTATDPPSPSNDETPRVIGSAQTGAAVDVYGAAACSGQALASGTAAQLSSPGLEVGVAANSSTSLSARVTDLAGNRSACSAPITYVEDSIPPETTIDSGPAPETVDPDATFSLSSDEPAAKFFCSLDGGAFQQCASRRTYPQLPAGPHVFRVRARDTAGNDDPSPAHLAFTLRAEAPPNILLIITDDQPRDTMQVMPNALRFFADQGTDFSYGYDVEPLCCPSRASIFSGMYPHNHGITINDGTGFDATNTWQRYLHELGYFTGITGKYLNAVSTNRAPHFDYRFQINPHDNPDEPALLTAHSAEFLDSAEASDRRPWAFVYSTSSPHAPWNVEPVNPQPQPPYDPPPSIGETDLSDKHPAVAARAAIWNPAKTNTFRDGILRELEASDEALGSLFGKLDQLGEEQDTLAIYISDNGFLWGQHSIHGKVWPYLESVNVPFYLRWPGHAGAGSTSPNLVANIDIAPTIFEAAQISPGYPLDGQSLLDSPARDWLLLESPTEVGPVPPWSSLITRDRQYIEWSDGFVEDYDLLADPWQLSAGNSPDPALAAELQQARSCVGASCLGIFGPG